jgi:hypothetical protein
MKRTILLMALVAAPFAAWAENRDQLVKQYSDFAGSEANSRSLVDGLRSGKEVKLSDGKTTTTFTPATGKMGNGNIKIALSLAEANLAKQGITDPTPAQIKAEVGQILQERADKKGWGQIAESRGFKVGDLTRSDKAERAAKAEKPERHARADKPERPERPEKPERPERPERNGRGPR